MNQRIKEIENLGSYEHFIWLIERLRKAEDVLQTIARHPTIPDPSAKELIERYFDG